MPGKSRAIIRTMIQAEWEGLSDCLCQSSACGRSAAAGFVRQYGGGI